MFKKYSSNTSCATGTSYVIGNTDGKRAIKITVLILAITPCLEALLLYFRAP